MHIGNQPVHKPADWGCEPNHLDAEDRCKGEGDEYPDSEVHEICDRKHLRILCPAECAVRAHLHPEKSEENAIAPDVGAADLQSRI